MVFQGMEANPVFVHHRVTCDPIPRVGDGTGIDIDHPGIAVEGFPVRMAIHHDVPGREREHLGPVRQMNAMHPKGKPAEFREGKAEGFDIRPVIAISSDRENPVFVVSEQCGAFRGSLLITPVQDVAKKQNAVRLLKGGKGDGFLQSRGRAVQIGKHEISHAGTITRKAFFAVPL